MANKGGLNSICPFDVSHAYKIDGMQKERDRTQAVKPITIIV